MYIKILDEHIINMDGIREITKEDDKNILITYDNNTVFRYSFEGKKQRDFLFDGIWSRLLEEE